MSGIKEFVSYPGYFEVGPGAESAALTSSLLAAVKTWATGYDWSSLFGAGVTVSSVKITEYAETATDVTPS